jgi:AcrR family transcriptional regulator
MKIKSLDQKNKILHTAAQLFGHQGYHGTSTKEIARVAEISENTLFRYFDHKETLFWATLKSRLDGLKLRKGLLYDLAEGASPEVVLPQILAQLVDTLVLDPVCLNLIAIAFIELRWKAEAFCLEHFAPIFVTVNSYVATCIEAGRMRNFDPTLVTAALAATVMVHSRVSRLISGGPSPYADSREAVRAYTKFWLAVFAEKGIPPEAAGAFLKGAD